MKYLLDTSIFIWMLQGNKDKIPRRVEQLMEREGTQLILSSVSTWEIAIKYGLGKLELPHHPRRWLPEVVLKMGLQQLPITQTHSLGVTDLPFHHKDPFDRLLVSQAKQENLPIISPDKMFRKYRVKVVW